ARRMQYLANGFFGDMRQSLLTQRLPQRHQRPRRRLILTAIGGALHFRQDARLLLAGVRRLAPSSRRYVEHLQTALVAPLDHLAHSLSAQAHLLPCRREAPSRCYTE